MAAKQYEFRLYKDVAGKWRWSLVAPNNRIIADSGESFSSKGAALKNIALVSHYAEIALTVEPK